MPLTLPQPTVVTALPSSPFHGQEVYYTSAEAGVQYWHLRYNANWTADSYKWMYVGGVPRRSVVDADENTTTYDGTWRDATTVVSVTAPLAGVYRLDHGCSFYSNTSGNNAISFGYKVGSAAAGYHGVLYHEMSSTVFGGGSPSASVDITCAASDVVKQQYLATVAFQVRWRHMALTPYRVI